MLTVRGQNESRIKKKHLGTIQYGPGYTVYTYFPGIAKVALCGPHQNSPVVPSRPSCCFVTESAAKTATGEEENILEKGRGREKGNYGGKKSLYTES